MPSEHPSASHINSIVEAVKRLMDEDRVVTRKSYNHWTLMSWHCDMLAPNQVRVYPGTLRRHCNGNYTTAQTDLTLSGHPVWIYVQHYMEPVATTIEQMNSEPTSDAATIRVPLYQFSLLTGDTWYLTKDCRLDANFGALMI